MKNFGAVNIDSQYNILFNFFSVPGD